MMEELADLVKVGVVDNPDSFSRLANRGRWKECLDKIGIFFGEPVGHSLLHFRGTSDQSGITQTDMVIFSDSITGRENWYESDLYANRALFQKIGMYRSNAKQFGHDPPYFALTNPEGLDRVRNALASSGFEITEGPSLRKT